MTPPSDRTSLAPVAVAAVVRAWFGLDRLGTTLRTEVVAGLTTFLTMAYIIAVNAQILSDAGMPSGAVVTATCLSAGLASILMGLWAKVPIGLAPGMGTNAYFAYVVCGTLGVPWPTALGAVFLSGGIFLAMSLTGLRERVIEGIPGALKSAIAGGIGIFVAFVGLQNAGLVVDHPAVLVQLGDLRAPGPQVTLVGLVVSAALFARGVKGALLLGIIAATALAVVLGVTEAPSAWVGAPPSLAPTFLALDLAGAFELGLLHLVFTFVFVDLFDTIATLVAVAERGNLMVQTPSGRRRFPRATAALSADAVGTIGGAALGTSTVTSYIESTAGIAAGGRSGLVAVVVGLCFLVAPFFAPLVAAVPPEATAPALVVVGATMMRSLKDVPWDDSTEAVPAALTAFAIPLTFSISEGLAVGFLIYPLAKLAAGRGREVSWLMAALLIVFAVRLFLF